MKNLILVISVLIVLYVFIILLDSLDTREPFDNMTSASLSFNDTQYYNLSSTFNNSSNDDMIRRSIKDPIKDQYLTFIIDFNVPNDYDFQIIRIYNEILNRQPNPNEMQKLRIQFATGEITQPFLYIILYNSREYENISLLQIDTVEPRLEYNIFVKQLYDFISQLYKRYYNKNPESRYLSILRDVFLYLLSDVYLFVAFLTNIGYKAFENEILNTNVLNEYRIKTIFDKHIILDNLKQIGDSIKKTDLKDGKSQILNTNMKFDIDKIKADNYILESNKTTPEDIAKIIAEQLKNQNNNNNNKDNDIYNSSMFYNENNVQKNTYVPISKCRYYYPTDYHKDYSKLIPLCTTLGKDNLVKPVYLSDIGTPINADTSVGSIMPKFEFREYIDVDGKCPYQKKKIYNNQN